MQRKEHQVLCRWLSAFSGHRERASKVRLQFGENCAVGIADDDSFGELSCSSTTPEQNPNDAPTSNESKRLPCHDEGLSILVLVEGP